MNRTNYVMLALMFAFAASSTAAAEDKKESTLKPASELKAPTGFKRPVSEIKTSKSGWAGYRNGRVGDWMETAGPEYSYRMEIYDLADHAVTLVTKSTSIVDKKEIKSETAIKMFFTEPERPEPKEKKGTISTVTKPSDRKFKVGDEEIVADQYTESTMDGKVAYRSWSSTKLPFNATLLSEDAEGKVVVKLVGYGRGK